MIKVTKKIILWSIVIMSIVIGSSKILERPEVNIVNDNVYDGVIDNNSDMNFGYKNILTINNIQVNRFPQPVVYNVDGKSMPLYPNDFNEYTEPEQPATESEQNQIKLVSWLLNNGSSWGQGVNVYDNIYEINYSGTKEDIDNMFFYEDFLLNVTNMSMAFPMFTSSSGEPLLEKRNTTGGAGFKTYVVRNLSDVIRLRSSRSSIQTHNLYVARESDTSVKFYLVIVNMMWKTSGEILRIDESSSIDILIRDLNAVSTEGGEPAPVSYENGLNIPNNELNQVGMYINNTENSVNFELSEERYLARFMPLLSVNVIYTEYTLDSTTGVITLSNPVSDIDNDVIWSRNYYYKLFDGSALGVIRPLGRSGSFFWVWEVAYGVEKVGVKENYIDNISSNINNSFKDGKATISLKVRYSEYKDENGNIVYTGKDGKIIKVGDVIEPYYYAKTGYNPETYVETYEDVPLLTDANDNPKRFLVTGSEINAGKSIYVNLDVVEIT